MGVKKILITTGDQDGIGPEVTFKALSKFKKKHKNINFFVFTSNKKSKFEKLIGEFSEVKKYSGSGLNQVTIIRSDDCATSWVETSAKILKSGLASAMVTAPLSKPQILKDEYSDLGHTDILKRISGVSDVFMTFLGKKMNVLLLSGHVPVSQIENSLEQKKLKTAVELTYNLKKKLKISKQIGVLGLNPHAGDQGLIGSFEQEELEFWINSLPSEFSAVGPLVPDAAFTEQSRKKYGFYISLYHDQGLIPFKTLHGVNSGVHLSLGLPFVRTSVDHGTAKDIFNKGIANPNSMIDALELAIKLSSPV